jgi:hypothetical protein
MTFFDDSAALTLPGKPFDPFAMDLDVSNVDDFLPDFMFAIAPFSATTESSPKITELPDDANMTPEMSTEKESDSSNTTENIPDTQIEAPVDRLDNRHKKRIVDIAKNDQLQLQRRFVSFSKGEANKHNQRA